jgi:putative transposase
MIDLFGRQVVGCSMRENMQTNAVTDVLRMAWFRRRAEPGLIFHSDRGTQYCSHEFQNELKRFEMKSSMSRKGNCWADLRFCHNAPTESLWGRLNVGSLYGRKFATRREVMDWINFDNHKRLHSTLGYVSPMTFEQRWTAAQQQDRQSA